MCTITLTYDRNNALARRKLSALLKTGLFQQGFVKETPAAAHEEDTAAHRQEVEEFLYGSQVMAAKAFAKHL